MLCVHSEITLACLCVFVCGVFVWDRESLSEYWFPPSLSLPQPYCSSLPDSHTLCCLLVRELDCLGVCQAPTVLTLHLCLCIWAPVTLATAFLFLKQLSESLRVSLRVCVFSSLCPNYEIPRNPASLRLSTSQLVSSMHGVLWKGRELEIFVFSPIKDQASSLSAHPGILKLICCQGP